MTARPFLHHRCTIQRQGAGTTDPENNPVPGDWADYEQDVKCLWWNDLGSEERTNVSRDVLANQSRMLMPATVSVQESDRITAITNRRGETLVPGTWEIKGIIPRLSESAWLLLLERIGSA